MDIEKNKLFRYIAGGCFAGAAFHQTIQLLQDGFDIQLFIFVAGYALVAASMFASMPIFSCVGAGACAIVYTERIITYAGYFKTYGSFLGDLATDLKIAIIDAILCVTFYVILIICVVIDKKNAKKLGVIAGSVNLIRFVGGELFFRIGAGSFISLSFGSYMYVLFLTAGAAMVGMALENMPTKPIAASAPTVTVEAHSSASMSNQFERLAKLKELLDSGVISQEEFEAKKKEILNQ